MRRRSDVSPARFRPLKAFAIVLAILVAVPGVDAVARVAVPSRAAGAADAGLDAPALLRGGDPDEVLDRLEDLASPGDVAVPDAYADEVGFPDGAHDVRVGAGGAVVGCVVPGEPPGVLARLTEKMEACGWTAVPLGGVEGATFVKQDGSCTWALVTCTQVGSETSVVARCLYR